MGERLWVDQAGVLGQPPEDAPDVREMLAACAPCGMLLTHLQQHVDEGASLEVLATEPLIEEVEYSEQLLLGCGATQFSLCFDPSVRPALLPRSEESLDQVILGRVALVERGLGDPGSPDHLVDAYCADPARREELIRRFEDPLVGWNMHDDAALDMARLDAIAKVPIDRPVCQSYEGCVIDGVPAFLISPTDGESASPSGSTQRFTSTVSLA